MEIRILFKLAVAFRTYHMVTNDYPRRDKSCKSEDTINSRETNASDRTRPTELQSILRGVASSSNLSKSKRVWGGGTVTVDSGWFLQLYNPRVPAETSVALLEKDSLIKETVTPYSGHRCSELIMSAASLTGKTRKTAERTYRKQTLIEHATCKSSETKMESFLSRRLESWTSLEG